MKHKSYTLSESDIKKLQPKKSNAWEGWLTPDSSRYILPSDEITIGGYLPDDDNPAFDVDFNGENSDNYVYWSDIPAWLKQKIVGKNRSGTSPNTSMILSDDELQFINEQYAGQKSKAIHHALELLMKA